MAAIVRRPVFSKEVIDVAVALIESEVEPDRVGNDIWLESVSLVGIHPPILSIPGSYVGDTQPCVDNEAVKVNHLHAIRKVAE